MAKTENLTRLNSDGVTYRIPVTMSGITFKMNTDNLGTSIFGDIADRLGKFESCGLTIEEIEAYAIRIGKLNKKDTSMSWG